MIGLFYINFKPPLCSHYFYGFNTQEKEDEIAQGVYTAEYWKYDSRIARRWNLDPKGIVGISDYACFGNNPIFFTDHDGDSIPTTFKDKSGKELDHVPDKVQKMYNKEYGIEVGYNAKTKMMYYVGEVKTDLKVSEKAKSMIKEKLLLTGDHDFEPNLEFGYNLLEDDEPNSLGVDGGYYDVGTATAKIDLADFDENGGLKGEVTGVVPVRTRNFARMMEHEYLGHGVKGKSDAHLGNGTGPTVKMVNEFRQQMGLPIRLHYGSVDKKKGVSIIQYGTVTSEKSRKDLLKEKKNYVSYKLQ